MNKERIQKLQQELDAESDFTKRLDLAAEIHKLKMEDEGVSPENTEIQCEGCGS